MYCLQWLIPILLIPKPVNPALLYNHVMFMVLYLFGFFIERKPCTICSLVFVFAVVLICSTGNGNSCIFWNNICNGGENDNDDECEWFVVFKRQQTKVILLCQSKKTYLPRFKIFTIQLCCVDYCWYWKCEMWLQAYKRSLWFVNMLD